MGSLRQLCEDIPAAIDDRITGAALGPSFAEMFEQGTRMSIPAAVSSFEAAQ